MLEFGSDFHYIKDFCTKDSAKTIHKAFETETYFVADGRVCLLALIKQYSWKRIWMPEYFCYEVIQSIKNYGIEVALYKDYPYNDDNKTVSTLSYKEGDVLLRMNYFGMRKFRDESQIPVPVIEDHTHNIFSNWAKMSNADWCIASLRKIFPIPAAGILWSPKENKLTTTLICDEKNEAMAIRRWKAMEMKTKYLNKENINKDDFRHLFLTTEDELAEINAIATIDKKSAEYLNNFNYKKWFEAKQRNIEHLKRIVHTNSLTAESKNETLFSLIILATDKEHRDKIRQKLIELQVYTAVLWNVPKQASEEVKDFSTRMISIHCDGRYDRADIEELAKRINQAL